MTTSTSPRSLGRRAGSLAGALVGAIAVTLAVSPSAWATPVADQTNAGPATSFTFILNSQWVGQTFTPSVTDVMSQVSVRLFVVAGSGPVTVRVFDTASGLPAGPPLASQVMTGIPSAAPSLASCDTVSPTVVTFSSPAELIAGHTYAFTLETTGGVSVLACTSPQGDYAGGEAYFYEPLLPQLPWRAINAQLIFTTFMGPVDVTNTLIERQSLPMPSSGDCSDVDDADVGYGTGIRGGWQRAWEYWVKSPTPDVAGGWACSRALVNTGGQTWRVDNSVL